MLSRLTACSSLGIFALVLPASASTVVFFDNFEQDAPAHAVTKLNQWTVTSGSVDVLETGDIAPPSHGHTVDLDGSTQVAATLVSFALNLPAGSYQLSFDLAGSQRAVSPTDSVIVSLNSSPSGSPAFTQSFSKNYSEPFTTEFVPFTIPSETMANLVFDAPGTDNMGLLLDNVQVTLISTPIPLPPALWSGLFLLTGLYTLSHLRPRST